MILDILRGNVPGQWLLLERLIGKKDFAWLYAIRDWIIVFWIQSVLLLSLAFAISVLLFLWIFLGIFLAIPGFVAFVILLVALAIITARITNAETSHERYSLLCLTNITDRELTLSFIFAGIYRVRRVLPFLVGFGPLIILSLAVVPAAAQFNLNGNTCWWVSPLGNTYCDRADIENFSSLLQVLPGSLVGSIGLTICVLGVVILTPVLTTGLLFVSRNEIVAVVLTLFLELPIASFVLLILSSEGFLWLWHYVSLAQLLRFSGVVAAIAAFPFVIA